MKVIDALNLYGKTPVRFAGLVLVGAKAQADEVVFSSSGVSPWQPYLGSSSNWMVPARAPETTSYKSKPVTVRMIDNVATWDALNMTKSFKAVPQDTWSRISLLKEPPPESLVDCG